MCTEIFFKSERKYVGRIGELADMLGGYEKLVVSPEDYPNMEDLAEHRDSCLCPVNIRASFLETEYILSQWEDGVDYTARKPNWLVEQETRERDRARYEAALAEMRAAPVDTLPKGQDAEERLGAEQG